MLYAGELGVFKCELRGDEPDDLVEIWETGRFGLLTPRGTREFYAEAAFDESRDAESSSYPTIVERWVNEALESESPHPDRDTLLAILKEYCEGYLSRVFGAASLTE